MEPLMIANKRQTKDLVTPHKISVLIFIREVCRRKNKIRKMCNDGESMEELQPAFDSNRQKREFAIVTLELIQGSDIDIQNLLMKIKVTSSVSLYESVLKRIKKIATDGISRMMDFIQSLETLLVDPSHQVPIVHKSSVIGLFIRRMMLVFDKLSFGQMTTLYHNYQHYCRTVVPSDDVSDAVDAEILNGNFDTLPTSQRQAELFVARQVALLQTNERAMVEPSKLQEQIQQLLVANPNLAEAHFLSLMNCLRTKEYCGAINALHRAFDCNTMDYETAKNEDASRNFRFAALNLGSLLCCFGYREEALFALQEATTMAREANDNVCLQHALSWLYRLENERKEMLVERSITKTGELSLPYLTSLGILTFAQMKASTTAKPALIFEFLRKCDILNCLHSILELMTQSYAQKASLWNVYGKKQMTLLSTQLLLHLNTSDTSYHGSYHCGEPLCRALCQLAVIFSNEGKYDRAEEVISLAREKFPPHSRHSNIWMFFEQVIAYDRALKRCEWRVAQVAVANQSTFSTDESKIREAELMLYMGETSKARQCLNELHSENGHLKDADYRVRVLILLGNCHCQSNSPSMAMMPLCSALALAKQYHLGYWQAVTMLHLAFVQYLMGCPSQAIDLMDNSKIQLLNNGSVYDHARNLYLHAKCRMAQARACQNSSRTIMQDAVLEMGSAAHLYLKAEAYCWAKDAFHQQAILYDELGYLEERNKASFQFRKIDQQHSTNIYPFLSKIL